MEFAIVLGVVLGVIVGILLGGIGMQVRASKERAKLETETALLGQRLGSIKSFNEELKQRAEKAEKLDSSRKDEVARLQAELQAANALHLNRNEMAKQMSDHFKALSAEVVSNSGDAILKGANEKVGALVKPLSDELKRIETSRNEAQGSLKQQIETLVESTKTVAQEARNLSTALTQPKSVGNWGETTLRRIVELAGMVKHCDFVEQVHLDGGTYIPDLIVKMPNERELIVDAKTPMSAYRRAAESQTEEDREQALEQHAKNVQARAKELSSKGYWNSLSRSPDFVVMYIPGEFFLQPALEKDNELFDNAMQQGVVIATPNTLMALLKTVAMGWREIQLAEEANRIATLGKELHDRIQTWASHMVKMESTLSQTVDHFNSSVGSLELRVLTSARRFKELGVSSDQDIPHVPVIEKPVRHLAKIQAPPTTPAIAEPTEQEQQQHLLGS